MLKLLGRKNKIENELQKNVKIFGENIIVQVKYCKTKNPELELQGKNINVFLPNKYKRSGNIEIVKLALEKMYDEIARIEIENIMEETRIMLHGLAPENYEIKRIPNKLAKCSADRVITINPDIVKYKKELLRYVILYEFCNLKYKTHGKGFYEMIKKYMPDYEQYSYLLDVA